MIEAFIQELRTIEALLASGQTKQADEMMFVLRHQLQTWHQGIWREAHERRAA